MSRALITNPRNNTPGVFFADRIFAKSIQVGLRADLIGVYTEWKPWIPEASLGITSIESTDGTLYRQVGDNVELIFNFVIIKDGTTVTFIIENLPIPAAGNTGTTYVNKLLVEDIISATYTSSIASVDNLPVDVIKFTGINSFEDGVQYRVNGQLSYKANRQYTYV